MGLVDRHAHIGVVVGMILAAGVVGCSGNTATPAFGYQTPAVETLAPTLAPTAVRTPAELATPAPGPTAPQPPFTQAQADLCYAQTRSIDNAWFAGNHFVWDTVPSSRDEVLTSLNPTLTAMIAVRQSGSDLLEPALSTAIAQLESLRDQLSQPMTADAIRQAGLQFLGLLASVDFLDDPYGLSNPARIDGGNNPNCRMIDAWIAANVKK